MRTLRVRARWILALAVLLLPAAPLGAAPFEVIRAGYGIGPIIIGMPVAKVSPTLGLEVTPRLSGNRVLYDYAKVGLTVWVADNAVVRIATRSPYHRTPTGVRPGQPWTDALLSICRGAAYTVETAKGFEVDCPFVGIGFEVTGEKLTSIAVFRASSR